MNKTSIDWCNYSWNVIRGLCPMSCGYCYARRIYKRFKLDPKISFNEKELYAPFKLRKPSRIFVGSTIEMYHPDIPREWISRIIDITYEASHHTYITLTKIPYALKGIEFPEWWWIGTSIVNGESSRIDSLKRIETGSIKFISFEPLLTDVSSYSLEGIDWIIIGTLNCNGRPILPSGGTKREWIEGLIRNAKERHRVPVYIKKEAYMLYPDLPILKEFPKPICIPL